MTKLWQVLIPIASIILFIFSANAFSCRTCNISCNDDEELQLDQCSYGMGCTKGFVCVKKDMANNN